MKKQICLLFLLISLAKAALAVPMGPQSLFITTITPLESERVPAKTVYDYLDDLSRTKQPQEQILLLSRTKKCSIHIAPGVDCQSETASEPVFISPQVSCQNQ